MYHRSQNRILCQPSCRLSLLTIVMCIITVSAHTSTAMRCYYCQDTMGGKVPDHCRTMQWPTLKLACSRETDICIKMVVNRVSVVNGTTKTVGRTTRGCYDNLRNNHPVGMCGPAGMFNHSGSISKPFTDLICLCEDKNFCNGVPGLVRYHIPVILTTILWSHIFVNYLPLSI